MKKYEQQAINSQVVSELEKFRNYLRLHNIVEVDQKWTRLRSCSAYIACIGHWLVLRSYNTVIALIDLDTDILYDFLRYVYGYTATSAQHISKFDHDYCGTGDYGCAHRLTYKEV